MRGRDADGGGISKGSAPVPVQVGRPPDLQEKPPFQVRPSFIAGQGHHEPEEVQQRRDGWVGAQRKPTGDSHRDPVLLRHLDDHVPVRVEIPRLQGQFLGMFGLAHEFRLQPAQRCPDLRRAVGRFNLRHGRL